MTQALPAHRRILGTKVHATNYEEATQLVLQWAQARRSSYLCATSVHGIIESTEDADLRHILNEADLITPDGMPLVWGLRKLGIPDASRVYGPNLTLHVCRAAAEHRLPVALYGGTPDSLDAFAAFLNEQFPEIRIVCRIAPPFRPLTDEEDEAYTQQIVDSGACIVFVGIGCPKQDKWCAAHRGRIPAVMLGVGAAFDFHAGRVKQAPAWMQQAGLEWFFRLLMEPRRLWKRYSRIVPRFIVLFGRQLIRQRLAGGPSPVLRIPDTA